MLLHLIAQATIETPTTAFLKAGLLGAAIVALAAVVLYLYLDLKKTREDFVSKLEVIQAARVADAQRGTADMVQALTNATNSVDAQTQANNELRAALRELEKEVGRCGKVGPK